MQQDYIPILGTCTVDTLIVCLSSGGFLHVSTTCLLTRLPVYQYPPRYCTYRASPQITNQSTCCILLCAPATTLQYLYFARNLCKWQQLCTSIPVGYVVRYGTSPQVLIYWYRQSYLGQSTVFSCPEYLLQGVGEYLNVHMYSTVLYILQSIYEYTYLGRYSIQSSMSMSCQARE